MFEGMFEGMAKAMLMFIIVLMIASGACGACLARCEPGYKIRIEKVK
jgi:hypothetical protein